MDFLNHKFHDDYDNEPKTNNLIISKSEFSFHFLNQDENEHNVDVEYRHTFNVIRHGKKFDVLILHALGKLIRSPQDYESASVTYQDRYYPVMPEPCTGNMRNSYNQILDRVQWHIPEMEMREEKLEFYYKIKREFNLHEDEVFVVYPQNYGKKFYKEAKFKLRFEAPYFADIQLLALPYDCVQRGGLRYISQFESLDGGKRYECTVKSLKAKNIYLITIRHRAFAE